MDLDENLLAWDWLRFTLIKLIIFHIRIKRMGSVRVGNICKIKMSEKLVFIEL